MADRSTNVVNFFSTTLNASISSGDTTFTVTSTVGGPASPCYIVIDPESSANREVIYCDGTFTGTTFTTTSLVNRDLDANGNLAHDAGKTVWVAPLAQHIDDLNDRIDAIVPITDHGGLSGLADDDHTIYARVNGARAWTASQSFADQEVIRPKLRDYAETVGTAGTSGTVTLNCETANVWTCAQSGNATFAFSNPPASGSAGTLTLILTKGTQTVAWPASVDWPAATAPDLSAAGTYVLTFLTTDAGTTWYGFPGGLGMG